MTQMPDVAPPEIAMIRARLRPAVRGLLGFDPKVAIDVRLPTLRLGSNYGGWCVVPECLGADSVVLSVGIGTDLSFDLGLIDRFGCRVQAYDPTPASLAWLAGQSLPALLSTHAIGLADRDGELTVEQPAQAGHASFHVSNAGAASAGRTVGIPVRRLSRLLSDLRTNACDLLKMDIEGAEYGVCRDIVAHGPRPQQLLVEFHHRMYGFTVAMTEAAIADLRAVGYRVFWASETGREFGLILAGAPHRSPAAAA
ncbi:MAG: FkbM family methyltransferase [Geminicoccaceae bacterium]